MSDLGDTKCKWPGSTCQWPDCRAAGCVYPGSDERCPEYDHLEAAEEAMHSAGEAARTQRQKALALGCLLPFVLLLVAAIAALVGATGR